MLVADSPETVARLVSGEGGGRLRGVTFAAGSFDGVHAGHAALAAAARLDAARRGDSVWALALRPHPVSVLAPDRAPPLITPGALQEEALAAAGFDGALFFPFSRAVASMEPARFVKAAFAPWLGAGVPRCTVVAGPNWRFGRDRAGRVTDLPALSGGAIGAVEAPLLEIGDVPVSSTRIREAVSRGDVELAAKLLGRPYRIRENALPRPSRGVGTQLGAPTANVSPQSALLPPPGVYALDVAVRDGGGSGAGPFRAVADFGWRPTFPDARPDSPILEIHLLGWDGTPLYGAALDIDFLRRLRDELRFNSPEELAAQIRADVAAAAALIPAKQ